MKRCLKHLTALAILASIAGLGPRVRADHVVPYTTDANTLLLDHLNGSTVMAILAITNNGQPCGSPRPSATPNFSYVAGPPGLGQALSLLPAVGAPAGSWTYLRHPTVDLLCVPNGTLELWCKPDGWNVSLATQGPFLGSCAGWTFGLSIDDAGHLTASDWAFGGNFSVTSSITVPTNTWTHVAVTWGSTGAKLYQNGELVGSSVVTTSPSAGFGGYLMLLGAGGSLASLAEVRVSNIQRTNFNLFVPDSTAHAVPYTPDANTSLLEHFDSSTSLSLLAITNNGQPCGSPRPSATPNFSFEAGPAGLSQAITLRPPLGAPAGSETYLRHPTVDLLCTPNGTLELWCKPSGWNCNLAVQGPYLGSCAGWTFGLGIDENGHLGASDWSFAGNFSLTASTVVPTNVWTHVAVTWGSAGAKLYQNGVLVASSSITTSPSSGFGGYLMVRGTGVSQCSIDELRISNIQRTNFNVLVADKLEIRLYAGLLITGEDGGSYSVQYTTNLSNPNWQPLVDLTLPSSPYLYVDTNSPAIGHRFYRAVFNP